MSGRRLGALALVLAASVWRTAWAVDRSKFRTCEQGSFCRRFKKWISRPDKQEALWSIVPSSKAEEGSTVTYKIQHKHEAEPHLTLKLDAYASGAVRIRVNEIDPVFTRHVIPPGDAVADPPPKPASGLSVSVGATSSRITFTSAAGVAVIVVMEHSPMSFLVTANGRMIQSLNARNFFNFERYRKPKQLRPPDAKASEPGADGLTIDSAQHPGVDRKGLWEEDFGGHTDRKPRGPASLGMDVSFLGNVPGLYGLSEHMTKANLPFYEEPYRFFNLDVFEYENNEPMALYGAIPFLWAIHSSDAGSATSGFLWINPSETFVKLERDAADAGPAHTWWTSESGVIDIAVFVGPTPAAMSAQFHDLTGHAPLAPLWALGKHQCRWNYMTQRDVATVDATYDKYDIPYDVIWLDIEHTDGKAYFTWNSASFPDPSAMMQGISDKRRKFVNVVDPHIKKDNNFHVYTEIRDKGLFTKKIDWKTIDDPTDSKPADWVEEAQIADPNATQPEVWDEEQDGKWVAPQIDNPAYKGSWKARQMPDPNSPQSDFEGWCWPGTSSYPDFTNPAMREYWGSQFALDKYKGTNQDLYVWNDMNEPSVFNGPEVTMARDTIHPHGNVEHRDVHNMYGYYVHRATFEGLAKRTPGDRPFVLTRSFFIGSHKYAAIWTGDNYAKWEHLRASIAMIGALTLGGQSLVGADVGGFFKHPDAEMVTRWYQLGVLLYPFLRNHAHLETPRREPYMYDETTMHRVRAALQLRYKMLPYWYTVYQAYHTKGEPVVRPLFWDFLDDKMTHADEVTVEDQIMLGSAVLTRGVSAPMAEASHGSVYLPVAVPGWYDLYTGDFSASGMHDVAFTMESVPSYVRSGAILPLKSRMRRSSSCMVLDPFTLNVYVDPDTGASAGRVYVDDYKTHAYTLGDNFLDVDLAFGAGSLKATAARGKLTSDVATDVEKVEIFGLKAEAKSATLTVKGASHSLPVPISRAIGSHRGSTLYAAVVKVKPFINLADGTSWSLSVA